MTAPIVTDHAVIRYAERVLGRALDLEIARAMIGPQVPEARLLRELRRLGLDPEALRAEIGAIVARGARARADAVLHGGMRYVLSRAGCVITVVPREARPRPRAAMRGAWEDAA